MHFCHIPLFSFLKWIFLHWIYWCLLLATLCTCMLAFNTFLLPIALWTNSVPFFCTTRESFLFCCVHCEAQRWMKLMHEWVYLMTHWWIKYCPYFTRIKYGHIKYCPFYCFLCFLLSDPSKLSVISLIDCPWFVFQCGSD